MKSPARSLLVFSAPFFLIGILGFGWGAHELVQGWRCQGWPRTEGVVTSAEIITHSGSADSHDTQGAKVSYDYKVDGKAYSAARVAFGDYTSGNASHASEVLNRYPVGAKVAVYYSPGDPENAVLETGVHPGVWIGIGVGAIMFAVGIMIVAIYRAGSKTGGFPN